MPQVNFFMQRKASNSPLKSEDYKALVLNLVRSRKLTNSNREINKAHDFSPLYFHVMWGKTSRKTATTLSITNTTSTASLVLFSLVT